jgi:hypothetical protein
MEITTAGVVLGAITAALSVIVAFFILKTQ